MNRNFFAGLAVFFLCVMTLSSCYDKDLLDSDKMSESVEWQPDWVIPVGYAKYKIWDILDQNDPNADIQNVDNVITLIHRENDIFRFQASEIIDIPTTQESKNVGIKIPDTFTIPFLGEVSKDFVDGIDITQEFKLQDETGSVEFSLVGTGISLDKLVADFSIVLKDNVVPFNYIIDIEFPNLLFEGNPYKVRFSGNRNSSTSVKFDLPDAEINFGPGNSIDYKVIVTIPVQENISFVDNENIDLFLSLENIVFHRAEGDFGNMSVDIGNGNFDMDVDLWNELDGNFEFSDPKIKLTVHNHNIGIPFEVDADFIGYNKNGDFVNIKKDDGSSKLEFEGIIDPEILDRTETAKYDTINSNIAKLFALPPNERVEYSGFVRLNPDSEIPVNNFITGDAEISLDAEIEVPLHFKAENLIFRDTITDVDLGIDSDKTDNIEKAGIYISYKSEIPLDVQIDKILFLNSDMEEIASLSDITILKSPSVDDNGDVTDIKESNSKIELTREVIDKLDETEHIEIIAKVSTSAEGSRSVKIPADAIIDFKMAFEIKLNLTNQ